MAPEENCSYYCTTDAMGEGPQHEKSVTVSTSWNLLTDRAGNRGNCPLAYGNIYALEGKVQGFVIIIKPSSTRKKWLMHTKWGLEGNVESEDVMLGCLDPIPRVRSTSRALEYREVTS